VLSSLKNKFLYQLAVSFLYSLAPIVVFPYISRTLGPDNIGKINFVDYTAQFFILFASFGIPLYAVREIAKDRNEKGKVARLSSEFIVIHLLFSLISLLGFGMMVWLFPKDFQKTGLLLITAANILLNAFSIEWLLQGLEDFAFLGKRSFVIKLLSVAAVFVFIHQASDYVLYYLLLVLTNVCVQVIDLFFVYRKGYRFQTTLAIRRHFKPLSIFFLTSATISIYSYFDTVILGLISGSLAVGFYTTGLKTIKFTQNFVNDIGGVLLPRMSFLIGQKDEKEIARIMNISLQYILTISVPLMFFIFLLSPEIIQVLAGKAFLASIPVLKTLSVLPLLIGLSNLFGTQVLLAFGKEATVLLGVVAGSVTSVTANLLLCPLYKEQGAAIACILAEGVVTIVLGWKAIRYVRFSVPKIFLVSLLLSGVIFYPAIWVIRQTTLLPFLQIIAAGVVCFGVYGIIQFFIFKNYVIRSMIDFVAAKFTTLKPES
jgi:O-antigen/teichoic acid export membrane protein